MSFAPPRTLAAVLTGAALAVGLTACGSSSSTSEGPAAAGAGKSAKLDARVNLAKCLRTHGINVPDPTSATSGYGRSVRQLISSYPHAQVAAAEQSCRPYLVLAYPQLTASPAQRAERLQQRLHYANCLRSHGINVPDPSSAAPGTGVGGLVSSVDRNSPAFKAASTACASLRPKKRAAGGASAGG